jgi:chemotaxis family two-component system sensor kinase Cph1
MGGATRSWHQRWEKDAVIDLTDCDREPIHIPGAIQRHGVLLVLDEPTLTVSQVSDNVGDHLPVGVKDILGQPLSTLIEPATIDQVREMLREERWDEGNPLHLSVQGKPFDGLLHRHEGAAILELEPNPDPLIPMAMYHPFRPALMRVQRVSTLAELAEVVVEQMRAVTGFERVMFYRFHEDGHGSVEAEAKEPALEPYLGLHYPASDIPAQARQLYLKSWLRLIFDANATPARMVPSLRADTGGPLDLTFAVLRSVSPIHLEYMANMGVRSSMSISLIVGDRLWGLISCLNHTSPRRISHEMRVACEFLGRLTSLQIGALGDRELLAQRASRRATIKVLAEAIARSTDQKSVFLDLFACPEELMHLVGAEGIAVVSGEQLMIYGHAPPPELVREIAAWVDEREGVRTFATGSLGVTFPPAREASDVASGLLTFALPGAAQQRILWFRPEIIKTVSWGGDPTKPVAADSGERLRPRHSFAVWRQNVRFQSLPWTKSDLEAADELQRRATESDLERRVSSEQRAVQTRDDLIAVVSHDLRTPLSSIQLQAEMILKGVPSDDEEGSRRLRVGGDRIWRSAGHMKRLIEDLLDLAKIEAKRFEVSLQSVDIRELIAESLAIAQPAAEAKRITIATQLLDAPRLRADFEGTVRVLSNLLANAIRFSREEGAVTVRTERGDRELVIAVVDKGPGIATEHLTHIFERYWQERPSTRHTTGLGLYIAKGIVEAQGGRIWVESTLGEGTSFFFTVPESPPKEDQRSETMH